MMRLYRYFRMHLMAVIIAGLLASPLSALAATPGDFDGNGVVSISDVQKTINAFLGLVSIKPQVTITTSMGTIVVELEGDKAPLTVSNFLRYVNEGFYTNTIFHRVVSGFVIQGGGYNVDGTPKSTHTPIKLEEPYDTGLSNTLGTIAMARTSAPTSATSQFFINTVDNSASLDMPKLAADKGGYYIYGYAVFGTVVQGLDVVKAIEAVAVSNSVPVSPITIISATQTR